jgi:hypothetical protein
MPQITLDKEMLLIEVGFNNHFQCPNALNNETLLFRVKFGSAVSVMFPCIYHYNNHGSLVQGFHSMEAVHPLHLLQTQPRNIRSAITP